MGGRDDTVVTYADVKGGDTGHAEVLHLTFDPTKVEYSKLLEFFFRMHDPTTKNKQVGDIGTQYRSAIFFHNDEQRKLAEAFIACLNDPGQQLRKKFTAAFGQDARVVTTVEPATRFHPAEDYHQQYLEKNPGGYCAHRLYW
ncbi:putative Peptide methionine sulfoxide reductase [Trypanosoma vivax]|nr:putative Peptide methionine sulfoxide reductase [Trypanosoma vivax]